MVLLICAQIPVVCMCVSSAWEAPKPENNPVTLRSKSFREGHLSVVFVVVVVVVVH